MENNQYKSFIVFWASQSVSQLGSSMTGFALIIWANYSKGELVNGEIVYTAPKEAPTSSIGPCSVGSLFSKDNYINNHKHRRV